MPTSQEILSQDEIKACLNGKNDFPGTVPWPRLEEREIGGDFWFCCWIKKEFGTVRKNSTTSFLNLWNDLNAIEIRNDFVQGNYFQNCPKDCVGFVNHHTGYYDYSEEEFASFSPVFRTNLSKVARMIRDKQTHVDAMPIRLKLHPTRICNLRCPMCNVHSATTEEIGEAYRQTIDTMIPYLNDLNIFGGEPFFCKLSREMIFGDEIKKSPHVHISTVTNGTMINPQTLERLTELRLGQFIFSIDSLHPEVYQKIRVRAKFDTVMDNLLRFIKFRDEGKLRIHHIGLSCTIQKLSYHEIPDIVEFCHKHAIGVNFSLIFGTSELYKHIPAVVESVKQGITLAEQYREDVIANRLKSILEQIPQYESSLKSLLWTDQTLSLLGKHRVMLFFQKHQWPKRLVKKMLRIS